MNIFLISDVNGKDGTARLARDISNYIDNNKMKDYLYFSYNANNFNFNINSLKSNPYSRFNILYMTFDISLILLKLIISSKIFKVNNIICLSENFSLTGYILSKIIFAKNNICCYGTYAQRLLKKNFIYKYCFEKSNLLVSSLYTKNNLIKECKNNRIFILKLFSSSSLLSKKFKEEDFKKKNEFIFVGGGNFYKRRKGYYYLEKVLNHLNSLKDPPLFKIVGNKKNYTNHTYLDNQNKEIMFNFLSFKNKLDNIYPKYKFLGQISNDQLANEYQSSLFHILLADHNHDEYDGFGLVHLEANTHKTFSIGSKLSGADDAIIYGKTFYPDDTKYIYKYILEIINNPYIDDFDLKKIRNINDYFQDLNNILIID